MRDRLYVIRLTDHVSRIGELMEIDIIIHLPSTDTGRTQLENKVSEIHADCIEKYMNNMGYSGMVKTNYEQIGIILSTLEEYGYMNQDRWNRFKRLQEELKITEKEIEKF